MKTCIDEGWYFKDPVGYSTYYNRPALILYSLARLVAKDPTGEFKAQREVLIRHLRQALDQSDHAIDKAMIASSLLRLGESISLTLSRDQVMQDAQSFVFFYYKKHDLMGITPIFSWRSEALSWALIYELLSFDPKPILWK